MLPLHRISIVAALLMLAIVAWTQGMYGERITDFRSDILVRKDATMRVTERITVQAMNAQIRHGIYRDFPTEYYDRYGNRIDVGFRMVSAWRDGQPEKYRIGQQANGVRIYLGRADSLVSPGLHTYTITYETNRQLGFYKDHDELYWNVTGNGWVFPIDRASAIVTLPPAIARNQIHVEAYTGPFGSKGHDYTAWVDDEARAHFVTTRGLQSEEGLTIVVSFPKGVITSPSTVDRLGYLFRDNLWLMFGSIGLLFTLAYFIMAWWMVGKDPAKGTIIPQYTPPEGLSPAAMRFIMKLGYDTKVFSASVINLAVKGYLEISEDGGMFIGRTFTLTQTKTPTHDKRQAVEDAVNVGDNPTIRSLAVSAGATEQQVRKWVGEMQDAGLPITVRGTTVTLDPAARQQRTTPPDILSAEEFALAQRLFRYGDTLVLRNENHEVIAAAMQTMQSVLREKYENREFVVNRAIFVGGALLALLVTVLAWGIGIQQQGSINAAMFILPVIFIPLCVLFYHLLKAPTVRGRKLMDQIAGFRMYLETAEKDELNASAPPEKTPELFERYLPYALALNVEQQWAEQFTGVLAHAAVDGGHYSPSWYHGSTWSVAAPAAFAHGLSSSFSQAISSASTPPGSSSGSGGGGSSGGGGGGGGGGGW